MLLKNKLGCNVRVAVINDISIDRVSYDLWLYLVLGQVDRLGVWPVARLRNAVGEAFEALRVKAAGY